MSADRPTCATCRWWHEVGSPHRPNIGLERVGNCHRFPLTQPTRLLIEASDWCGEHAPVEVAAPKEADDAR